MKTMLPQLVVVLACVANYSPAVAKEINPPGVNPQHFQCYNVKDENPKKRELILKDQFGKTGITAENAVFLCNPVSKNGGPIRDKRTHLVCYELVGGKPTDKKVKVQNQFGTDVLLVDTNKIVCVPSLKSQ